MQPTETRIGYEFRSEGLALDLERTQRLMMRTRQLRPHPERGVARRQFHVRPQLDLYLDNLELRPVFESPQKVLCVGRSQGVAWVTAVGEGEDEPVERGE